MLTQVTLASGSSTSGVEVALAANVGTDGAASNTAGLSATNADDVRQMIVGASI
jgi:hypothetical protein